MYRGNGHDSHLYQQNRRRIRQLGRDNQLVCHYCHMPIDYDAKPGSPLAFTVDHVVPVHSGGSDRMDNLVPAHFKCNRAKSDRLVVPLKRTPHSATRRWW